MIKVGIIGATGYVGAELIRLLSKHPKVTVAAISSNSFQGKELSEIYGNFSGIVSLICEDENKVVENSDVIFTALPHGLSESIAKKAADAGKILIDMGADFRLENEENYKQWYGKSFDEKELHDLSIYGLPELNRAKIKESKLIGNPGCYPTSSILGLMPALKADIINEKNIIIDAKSGITGAGRGLTLGSHYPECNESFSAYGLGGVHRHTPEIEEGLSMAAGKDARITFSPHLLPLNRGILATIYSDLKSDKSLEEIWNIYNEAYKNEPFVKVLPLGEFAKIKNVKYSNYCHISIHKDERCNRLIVCSAIDNMIKGAAGQGIQNMNLVLGFEETLGIDSLPPAF